MLIGVETLQDQDCLNEGLLHIYIALLRWIYFIQTEMSQTKDNMQSKVTG